MTTEHILINVTPQETRVAVLASGVVQELLVERTANRGIVGATRSSPAVGARLRRIANTRMWPYR